MPARPASPCTRARTSGTSAAATSSISPSELAPLEWPGRVQHRRRSAARPGGAGARPSSRTSARSCPWCPVRSRARRGGRRRRRSSELTTDLVARMKDGRRARERVRRPRGGADSLGPAARCRPRRALHGALRPGVRARARPPPLRPTTSTRPPPRVAHDEGLGINAGHDLDLRNLTVFHQLPHLDEVSIGHALIAHALYVGLRTSVKDYLSALQGRHP